MNRRGFLGTLLGGVVAGVVGRRTEPEPVKVIEAAPVDVTPSSWTTWTAPGSITFVYCTTTTSVGTHPYFVTAVSSEGVVGPQQ